MKYYFDTPDGIKHITLKRASRQWINYDTPSIYTETGSHVLSYELGMTGLTWVFNGWISESERITDTTMARFIDASERSFVKWMSDKYADYAERWKKQDFYLAKKFLTDVKIPF